MRLFIGIDISTTLKGKIIEIQKRFGDEEIKFVEKENLHFCMKFLGEACNDDLTKIKEVMNKVAEQFEKFTIDIHGLDAFPNKNYVKVLFFDVKEGREVMKGIASVLEELGKENREYVPHLTLGRVKHVKDRDKFLKTIKELENIEIGKMEVAELKLIKSELTPKGPVYKDVFTTHLGT